MEGRARRQPFDEAYMAMQIVERPFADFFEFAGRCAILLGHAVVYIASAAVSVRETVRQMASIGVQSMPVVLVTVAFSGAVMALHTARAAASVNIGGLLGFLIGKAVSTEIGPVLTGVVVAARSGSAIAAEIGSMKVTEQIDALRAMAVSPVRYLVAPRLIAAALMMPVITVYADVVGWLGGMFVAATRGVSHTAYMHSTRMGLTIDDVALGLVKTVFFGGIIAIVGCQQGLLTTGGAAGVGRSTTRAVVLSIVLIYISNYFLSSFLYGHGLGG
jgi:phospholipid/cholesterol/gamma-HCH transport system permease protein